MIRVPHSLAMVAVLFMATVSASCVDPVHSDDVAALGGEVSGVREGPTHRPGQPCLVCHGSKGPGSPEFEIAGTIYETPGDSAPVEGVELIITDATGKQIPMAASNRAGNFYLEKDRQTVYYPLTVVLSSPLINPGGSSHTKEMVTPIGRNGGCAFCHVHNIDPADKTTHMPHVYLNNQ